MTKDSEYVQGWYLGKALPPLGTQTNRGKIKAYCNDGSVEIGRWCFLRTRFSNEHQVTLEKNNIKILNCPENQLWIDHYWVKERKERNKENAIKETADSSEVL